MSGVALAPARPAARASVTLVAWGAVTCLGALLLPWARAGRDLVAFVPQTTGLDLLGRDWPVAAAVVCGALAGMLGGAPLPLFLRGRLALAAGGLGLLATVVSVASRGAPMGPAPVVGVLGFLALVGIGLALGGYIRADAFISVCIVWSAAFVLIFILYPLLAVLQASVVVGGRFTLDVLRETVRSPLFLLIDNPNTPQNEWHQALRAGALLTAAAALVALALTRKARPTLLWTAGTAVLGTGLIALYLGFGAVRNSVLLAAVVGVISTGLGFLFALLAERSRLPTRRLFGPVSILPIITPPFVLGLAVIYLFGRRGFVTHQVLGLSTTVFFGPLGVALAQVLAYTPIAFLILQGVVRALDVALEEAAETLGADRWHTLRTVIWPLARPGLANAFLLVAIESLADFGNPIIVGGGQPYLATEVFFSLVGRYNPNEAAVFGLALLAMTLTIFLLQYWWIGRASYVTVTGRPSQGLVRPLPPALDYGVTAIFVVWVLVIVALYGSVAVGSVTKLWGFDYTFTLYNWEKLSPTGWQVFRNTLTLASIAAIPSTVVGFLIGYLVTRYAFPGRGALEFSSMLSFATPGTVMGIGYILAFNQGPLLLTGTELIIILAFVFRNMPVALRAGVAAVLQIDRSLEEASTMLRAGSPVTLRRIVLPLVRGAILAGLVFSFVRAMTAISQVIFLVTPRTSLATTQILSYVNYGTVGLAAALSWVLVVFMSLVIVALYLVNQRLAGRRPGEIPTLAA
ncbi:MAG: iron ABC transporter permease [Armatimonadota bacterium]|nr:iron ABC transporter permease [Armatimonadota bacterium]